MRRLWLRVVLVVTMLAAIVVASLQIFRAEQRIANHRMAEQVFAEDTWLLTVALSDLRAAQHAYVSAGQGAQSWMVDVTRRFEEVGAYLSALAGDATATGAIGALTDAAAIVASLQRTDVQIREHVLSERHLIASDLIFTDTGELTAAVVDRLERARISEGASLQAAIAAERWTEGILLAGGAGAVLLVVLLLLPRSGGARTDEAGETDGTPLAGIDSEEDTSVDFARRDGTGDLLGLKETDDIGIAAAPDAPSTTTEAMSQPAAIATPAAQPSPDLQRAADLCTDLVRSNSPADLPALLARAAQILNASGIIVWVLDGTGNALRPAVGHGYSSAALGRIGPLPCDGDNATAAAWRKGRMHVVASQGVGSYGAIVAPLVSPERCSGVLSLELNDGWERSEAVQSTVEIVAAQLATLVSADPAADTAGRAHA